MNPVNTIRFGDWSLAEVVVALFFLLVVVVPIVWRSRRGRAGERASRLEAPPIPEERPRSVAAVFGSRVLAAIGVAVVAAMFVSDHLERGAPFRGYRGADVVAEVVNREHATAEQPDRLLILVATFDTGTVEDPVTITDFVLPFDSQRREFHIDELGVSGALWREGEADWQHDGRLAVAIDDSPRGSGRMNLPNLNGLTRVSMDTERSLFDTDVELGFKKGLVLRAARDNVISVFVKPIYPTDELRLVPAREVGAFLGAALRRGAFGFAEVSGDSRAAEHSFVRLLEEVDPFGAIALLVSLLLVVAGFRFVPACAGVLFGAIAVLSLATRLEVGAATSDLRSADPVVRRLAVGRLAAQNAFADDAARALDRASLGELDPEVRLAMVCALEPGARTFARSVHSYVLLERARYDEDADVRAAASRVDLRLRDARTPK